MRAIIKNGGFKMKRFLKSTFAFLLVFAIFSSTLICFAAKLNQNAVKEHKGQFKKYVLLGDSVASGYRDVMCDEDDAYNKAYQQTVYCRVPGSYADVLTKAIIEDNTMTAFAAPGYRTVEIRYMLEDDFQETDEYMFHPSQLNVVGDAGSQEYRAAYKKAVAEADLITLGVGGNDWGAYIGWVVADIFEKEGVADKYMVELQKIMENNSMGVDTIEDIVEIVHVAGVLPELVATLPSALSQGLSTFYKNWDIMIQDIYDLNPDVTLMVLGMSDNGVKGNYYGYNGEEGEPIVVDEATQSGATKTIVDFIMSVGNKPMIEGEEKFGYTYVDTAGTTYVESHPDAGGHVYIANKIIEALPTVASSNNESIVEKDNETETKKPTTNNNKNNNESTTSNKNNEVTTNEDIVVDTDTNVETNENTNDSVKGLNIPNIPIVVVVVLALIVTAVVVFIKKRNE